MWYALFTRLDLDLRPSALLEAHGGKEEAGDLVCQDTQPDAYDPEAQHITAQIGACGADKGDADGGGDGGVQSVPGADKIKHCETDGDDANSDQVEKTCGCGKDPFFYNVR